MNEHLISFQCRGAPHPGETGQAVSKCVHACEFLTHDVELGRLQKRTSQNLLLHIHSNLSGHFCETLRPLGVVLAKNDTERSKRFAGSNEPSHVADDVHTEAIEESFCMFVVTIECCMHRGLPLMIADVELFIARTRCKETVYSPLDG